VPDSYRQYLPALELSIERHTNAVPNDGWWYLLRAGETLGRFKTRKAAQEAWGSIVAESGWQPEKPEARSTEEMLSAERAARDRDARNEYWHSGRRHAW
jgi:hypothetical protein